jgi:hypothetical protein
MSEEINEDNCVLSYEELARIEVTFEEKYVTHGESTSEELNEILKKITKLNDMAKQAKEMQK